MSIFVQYSLHAYSPMSSYTYIHMYTPILYTLHKPYAHFLTQDIYGSKQDIYGSKLDLLERGLGVLCSLSPGEQCLD